MVLSEQKPHFNVLNITFERTKYSQLAQTNYTLNNENLNFLWDFLLFIELWEKFLNLNNYRGKFLPIQIEVDWYNL